MMEQASLEQFGFELSVFVRLSRKWTAVVVKTAGRNGIQSPLAADGQEIVLFIGDTVEIPGDLIVK